MLKLVIVPLGLVDANTTWLDYPWLHNRRNGSASMPSNRGSAGAMARRLPVLDFDPDAFVTARHILRSIHRALA